MINGVMELDYTIMSMHILTFSHLRIDIQFKTNT